MMKRGLKFWFSAGREGSSRKVLLLFLFLIIIFFAAGAIAEIINEFDVFSGANAKNVTIGGNSSFLKISSQAPYDRLIVYYSFDENANSTIYDYSNEGNDGTNNGSVYNSSGIYDGIRTFDGTDDYIKIGNIGENEDSNFSVSAWINPYSISTNNKYPLGKGTSSGFIGWVWWITSSKVNFLIPNSALNGWLSTTAVNSGTLTNNEWVHLVTIKNGTFIAMYKNGIHVSNTTLASADVGNFQGTQSIYLGAGYKYAIEGYFNGSIDEVMIFNAVLTPSQISDIYNNQSSRFADEGTQEIKRINSLGYNIVNVTLDTYSRKFGSNISLRLGEWDISKGYNKTDFDNQEGLASYWHFDENSWNGTSGEAIDAMGINNGTGQQGANTTSEGFYYRGVSCDGIDDFINMSFSQNLNFTRAINPDEWSKFNNSNQVIRRTSGTWDTEGATFASVMNDSGEIKMWYHGWNTTSSYIGYANSSNGKSFTKQFSQPIFFPNFTHEKNYKVPNVWKEGNEYHMIYTYMYNDTGSWLYAIGHANSSNGINWTKDSNNPILNYTQSFSAIETNSFENCFGVMKVESMYYMWFSGWEERQIGLANSTNLSHFEVYQEAPIFDSSEIDGDKRRRQFCPHAFKHGSYYYLLVPSYDETDDYSWLYLYRDTNPTFLAANRQLARVAIMPNRNGTNEEKDEDLDTPWILTNITNIQRDIPNGELWTYYATYKKSHVWGVSLSIESNVTAALELKNMSWINSSEMTLSAWVKFNNTQNSMIISKGGNSYFFGILNNTGNFVFGDSDGYKYTNASYNDGEWHHVVGKHTGINLIAGLKIYVDGVEAISTITSGVFHGFYNEQGDGLGICSKFNGTTNLFNGSIDEIMIFNRSLSTSEIEKLYVKGRALWNYTDYQNLTAIDSNDNSSNNQFFISSSTANLLPVFKLLTGTNNFYSPILKATSGLTLNFQDTISPIISFSCSPTSATTGQTITCSCSGTDNVDSSPNVSYTLNPSTYSSGTFTTTCAATDDAGNSASSSVCYTISSLGGGGSSSSGSGSNSGGEGTPSFYTNTIIQDEKEFSEIKTITEELMEKERIRIKIDNKSHYIGVVELTGINATIEIFSTPQKTTFNIGDEKGFDVNDDNYYDIYVKLNSINDNKTNLTIRSIHEEILAENKEVKKEEAVKEPKKPEEKTEIEKTKSWLWLVLGLVIIAIAMIIKYKIKKR